MYGYADDNYVPLHKDTILERVSQEEIMRWLTGESIILRRKFRNPFRKDRNPGCHFWYSKGRLLLADFADDRFHNKDCFGLTMARYSCDFMTALEHINQAFRLGLGTTGSILPTKSLPVSNKLHKKEKTIITYEPGNWVVLDKKFWSQWDISRVQLEEDGVVRPRLIRYIKGSESSPIRIYDYMYCYVYTFPSGNIKIYQPYSSMKWITNTTIDDIGCFEFLDDAGDLLIITKSYKDCRVLRNMGYQSIWVQNERVKMPEDVVKNLCGRFKRILLLYDNDETGVDGAMKLCACYNAKCGSDKFIPAHYPLEYGVKDTAEFYFEHGKDKLKEVLDEITNYCT